MKVLLRKKALKSIAPLGSSVTKASAAVRALNGGSSVIVLSKNKSIQREYILDNRKSANTQTQTMVRDFSGTGASSKVSRGSAAQSISDALADGGEVRVISSQGYKKAQGRPTV